MVKWFVFTRMSAFLLLSLLLPLPLSTPSSSILFPNETNPNIWWFCMEECVNFPNQPIFFVLTSSLMGRSQGGSGCYQGGVLVISAWVTLLERPKGVKGDVQQTWRPEGPQTRNQSPKGRPIIVLCIARLGGSKRLPRLGHFFAPQRWFCVLVISAWVALLERPKGVIL